MNKKVHSMAAQTLTIDELARVVRLAPITIRRDIKTGRLKAANGGGRSRYRISPTDAESWWRGRGGGTLLGDSVPLDTPQTRAATILAGLDSDDIATRNAAIVALASADAQTSHLVEIEAEKSVAAYGGPEEDFSRWQALDSEPFYFPEEEVTP